MKFLSGLAVGAVLVGQSFAHPVAKRQDIDTTVLQFALTLEHLENVFYKQAIATLSEQMFIDAGYDASYYSSVKYIAHDEESHVVALEGALKAAGVTPNAACTYSFPFTDVASFITLSSILEGVGTSAYLGAAPLITEDAYLTVAGSILVVEALHTSLQRSARGVLPIANPYGTPLNPNPVYTLAAAFITSCPASNAALPFMAFPSLGTVTGMPTAPGVNYEFSTMKAVPAGSYATFVSGLAIVSVPISGSGTDFMAMVPMGLGGQTYVFVTSSDTNGTLTDAAIVAGPAIIEVTADSPTFDPSIL